MKKNRLILTSLGIPLLLACSRIPRSPAVTVDMDFGWKFFLGDPVSAQAPGFDDGGWREVNVPHDWSVELPVAESNPSGTAGGFFAGGIGWYRKTFSIPPEWKNKTLGLEFDGIFRNSTIWLNGRPVGGRAGGYMPQSYNVSALVRTDRDVAHVTVRVTDLEGETVPAARNLLRFTLEGAGIFLGADNGDLADHTLYAKPVREARGGTCLVLLQSSRVSGRMRLTAEADGLKPGSLELRSR